MSIIHTKSRWLLTALAVAVLGSIASWGIFGAFSATTSSSGNEVQSGTVFLNNNSLGSALIYMRNAPPGESQTRCLDVTYTGSVPALVALYIPQPPSLPTGELSTYIELTITQGTQTAPTFPSCTGFTPLDDSQYPTGVMYSGSAADFTYDTFASGLTADPSSETPGWQQGDSLVYEFKATLAANAPTSVEGETTGPITIDWQAENLGN